MGVPARNLRKAEPVVMRRRSTDENGAMTPETSLGMTVSEAARALGVSVSTVRRWSDAGALRSSRTPGGQRRFSEEQIEAFVRSLSVHEPERRS